MHHYAVYSAKSKDSVYPQITQKKFRHELTRIFTDNFATEDTERREFDNLKSQIVTSSRDGYLRHLRMVVFFP